MNASIENVSRRGFLKNVLSAGAFLIAVRYLPDIAFADEVARSVIDKTPLDPSVYVGLETDGTVTSWRTAQRWARAAPHRCR